MVDSVDVADPVDVVHPVGVATRPWFMGRVVDPGGGDRRHEQ